MRMQSILVKPYVLDCLQNIEDAKRMEEEKTSPTKQLRPKKQQSFAVNGALITTDDIFESPEKDEPEDAES